MKIIAIGRNYIDHAKELNNPVPKKPIFFLKPETAILRNNKAFFIPDFSKEIHYELEVVLRINKIGKYINKKFANKYFNEIGLGIDFTARDLQKECKKNGHPWEIAKAFDNSAPIGTFVNKENFPDLKNISFKLFKNEKIVQHGNTGEMIFDFSEIISYISKFVSLKIGDLIFTGTPAGVGKVEIGDKLTAYLEDEKLLDFEIK